MLPEGLAGAPAVTGVDIVQDGVGKSLHRLLGQGLALGCRFSAGTPQGHGAGYAVGDAGTLNGLLVLAEPDVDAAPQGGDVHGVPHGVLDVVAIAAVIALLGDKDGGLNFAVLCADVHLAGLDIELMDGQAADAVFTGQLHDGIPCVEGGGGVGGGHTVAGVAADGADVDVDLDDIGDTVSGDTGFLSILSNVKIPGVVIGSICDGIVNSLMTLRIGYVTRNYLIDGMNSLNGIKAKRKAKRAAVKEALKSLPKVVVVGTSFVGKGAMNIILNIIGGKKVKETNEANVAD